MVLWHEEQVLIFSGWGGGVYIGGTEFENTLWEVEIQYVYSSDTYEQYMF